MKPHLGHIELGKLRVDHVSDMFDAIDAENERTILANAERTRLRQAAKEGGRTRDYAARREALDAIAQLPGWKRPTGPVTKQRIRDVLRNALNAAIVQELISLNVAELVELDAAKRPAGDLDFRTCRSMVEAVRARGGRGPGGGRRARSTPVQDLAERATAVKGHGVGPGADRSVP